MESRSYTSHLHSGAVRIRQRFLRSFCETKTGGGGGQQQEIAWGCTFSKKYKHFDAFWSMAGWTIALGAIMLVKNSPRAPYNNFTWNASYQVSSSPTYRALWGVTGKWWCLRHGVNSPHPEAPQISCKSLTPFGNLVACFAEKNMKSAAQKPIETDGYTISRTKTHVWFSTPKHVR